MKRREKGRVLEEKSKGQLLVEFAIALPVLVMLALGAIQIARLMTRQIQMEYGAYMAARGAAVSGGDIENVSAILRQISSHLDPDNEDVDVQAVQKGDWVSVIVRVKESGLFPLPAGEMTLKSRMDFPLFTPVIRYAQYRYVSNAKFPGVGEVHYAFQGVGASPNANSGYDKVLRLFAMSEAKTVSENLNRPTGLATWYPVKVMGSDEAITFGWCWGWWEWWGCRRVYGNHAYLVYHSAGVAGDAIQNFLDAVFSPLGLGVIADVVGAFLDFIGSLLWGNVQHPGMPGSRNDWNGWKKAHGFWSRAYTALAHGQMTAWFRRNLCWTVFGWSPKGCGHDCLVRVPIKGCVKDDDWAEKGLNFNLAGRGLYGWGQLGAGFKIRVTGYFGVPVGLEFIFNYKAAGLNGFRNMPGEIEPNRVEWAFINGTYAAGGWPELIATLGANALVVASWILNLLPGAGTLLDRLNIFCYGGLYEVWEILPGPGGNCVPGTPEI